MSVATGLGYDVHQLVEGRPLIIGGVAIPHTHGLLGHSDADVLTHAIIDALLGAAGLGDIGQHFPDTDERYRDADSIELLAHTVALLISEGYRLEHIDATVVIEQPKLLPFKPAMHARLLGALGVSDRQLNLKATRGEGMGFVGRLEGAAALAIATVSRSQQASPDTARGG
ncbi:MAG TPA: 2-C-methyl-D-erythritol 2,4-cyclodiphosphate synthase [Solirubrobacteraceae bacterium]|nr:2-C-methyl-D-erythritol 2,4-cyclodiphosphate synthase [Solirubrobacteraceae bacterium]